MTYVDFNSDIRWTDEMHKVRIAETLDSRVPHGREHVLFRRMFAMMVLAIFPAGHPLRAKAKPLTEKQTEEVFLAADAYLDADLLADEARIDSARLDKALDHEEAQRALASLLTVEEGEEDPNAEQRLALQAVIDAATEDTVTLVAARYAFRNPPPAIEAPAAEEADTETPEVVA